MSHQRNNATPSQTLGAVQIDYEEQGRDFLSNVSVKRVYHRKT